MRPSMTKTHGPTGIFPKGFNPDSEAVPQTERGSPDPQRVEQVGTAPNFPSLWSSQRAASLESRAPGALPISESGFSK